tara:strand:+ start:480 stop:749 length:270 start_codon:yes stop_codon:yes gene_type:complete
MPITARDLTPAERLANADACRWSLLRVLAIHEQASGLRREALNRYARSARWTLANADLTSHAERRAAYFALHAVGEIARLYPTQRFPAV